MTFDLDGGNRIPKAAERQARSVAELRDAGIGVRRVLFVHDGTQAEQRRVRVAAHDGFRAASNWMWFAPPHSNSTLVNGHDTLVKDREWAEQLGRPLSVLAAEPQSGAEIVRLSREGNYDAIVLPAPSTSGRPPARTPTIGCRTSSARALQRVHRHTPGDPAGSGGLATAQRAAGRFGVLAFYAETNEKGGHQSRTPIDVAPTGTLIAARCPASRCSRTWLHDAAPLVLNSVTVVRPFGDSFPQPLYFL